MFDTVTVSTPTERSGVKLVNNNAHPEWEGEGEPITLRAYLMGLHQHGGAYLLVRTLARYAWFCIAGVPKTITV